MAAPAEAAPAARAAGASARAVPARRRAGAGCRRVPLIVWGTPRIGRTLIRAVTWTVPTLALSGQPGGGTQLLPRAECRALRIPEEAGSKPDEAVLDVVAGRRGHPLEQRHIRVRAGLRARRRDGELVEGHVRGGGRRKDGKDQQRQCQAPHRYSRYGRGAADAPVPCLATKTDCGRPATQAPHREWHRAARAAGERGRMFAREVGPGEPSRTPSAAVPRGACCRSRAGVCAVRVGAARERNRRRARASRRATTTGT